MKSIRETYNDLEKERKRLIEKRRNVQTQDVVNMFELMEIDAEITNVIEEMLVLEHDMTKKYEIVKNRYDITKDETFTVRYIYDTIDETLEEFERQIDIATELFPDYIEIIDEEDYFYIKNLKEILEIEWDVTYLY